MSESARKVLNTSKGPICICVCSHHFLSRHRICVSTRVIQNPDKLAVNESTNQEPTRPYQQGRSPLSNPDGEMILSRLIVWCVNDTVCVCVCWHVLATLFMTHWRLTPNQLPGGAEPDVVASFLFLLLCSFKERGVFLISAVLNNWALVHVAEDMNFMLPSSTRTVRPKAGGIFPCRDQINISGRSMVIFTHIFFLSVYHYTYYQLMLIFHWSYQHRGFIFNRY